MSKESIIGSTGDISVTWKAETVTWHIVLQTARTTNADDGGWNRQSRWSEHGLEVMASIPEELQKWTSNSLDLKAHPQPREAEFQLELRELVAKSGTRGGKKKFPQEPEQFGIKFYPKKPEDRLNWWLYMAQRCAEKKLTYELPLCAESDGLLRADLVHFVPENGLVEIIELKKGKTEGRDSPLMALVEAICYGLQLLRCWGDELQQELKDHLGVDPFELKHLHLVLAAPDFGKDCSGKDTKLTEEQAEKLRAIVSIVEQAIAAETNLPRPTLKLSFGNVIESEWTLEELLPESERVLPSGSLLRAKSK